ncbi:hypothetical protein AMAG_04658 [Allomyces macrogynus ATCC 38327]|uniref:Zinc/iron permease n=1 Tax=Allomyces macrogynus (strain ATCC 38327) TaxID=578462 RepID=A0A0L0S5W8_ALLM3|nr:hypothetical protein AMAG_04658 [Allomyces macrogynus ATCC 38327]|eukprot:KNE57811.1 hypothetical protein AMAG_04658 [Allomyces macrogynus ATCC 38327]
MIRRSRTPLLATALAALAALLVIFLASGPSAVFAADTPTPSEFMDELFEHFARNVTGVSEPVINTDRLLHLYEHLDIVNKSVTVDKWPTDLHDCLTPAQLLQAYEIKESYVNRAGLEKISPGLVAMKASSACTGAHAHGAHEGEKKDDHAEHDHAAHDHADHADHDEDSHAVSDADKLSTGLVWLYSIIAELIVSGFAVLGITLVPYLSKHRRANQLAMTFLIGLAVGTLLGDAIMHLIPESLGVHDHGGEGDEHEHEHEAETNAPSPVWTSLVVVAGAYAFFLVEHILHSFGRGAHEHSHGAPAPAAIPSPKSGDAALAPAAAAKRPKHGVYMKESEYDASQVLPVAWLILFGDAVHNTLDGLAIGVAFAASWRLGVSTAIAVLLHELPHELGDYAVLLSSGIPRWRAAVYNVLCNMTSFVGLAIGILVFEASSSGAQSWILAFTAGGFLYISLSNLVPMLFEMTYGNDALDSHATSPSPAGPSSKQDLESGASEDAHLLVDARKDRGPMLMQQLGVFMGVGIMLLIALFGESITV